MSVNVWVIFVLVCVNGGMFIEGLVVCDSVISV